ncbi:heme biosynthesis HemY N-terminal domain-containing protein [Roseomonas sp. HF4]|uniref:heme biosynthesis HemY N-terminal domain-containing protein n=1 Tax=Roseomonas sp. HF4 TaxID=2562313 RepID=UPI0010C01FD5|nr:heme biosynthesis HemY N-terminal domain-containing protein [Roseomonas sp. HF4]
MRRALLLLAALSAVTALALWLARVGGTVEIAVGETWIGVTFPIAVMALVLAFVLLHGVLSLFHWIGGIPARQRIARREQRRAEGDAAVTRALVALAAGTAQAARVEVRRARMLLGDTPQTLVLAAEAERLAGREDAATAAFKALAERPEARFLGLRGLLRQAVQRQDWVAAQRLATEAEAAQPGAAWLRVERQALALSMRDWRGALALAAPEAPRAALAYAASLQEEEPERAAEFEKQAFAADPAFAPAALAVAKRAAAAGAARRARSTLEQSWIAAPHPDIGAAWLAGEKDRLARVKSVEDLVHRNRDHPESRLLMAREAIGAGLTGRARSELEALVASRTADRRAFLLLAELEEVEQGDTADARAAQAKWLRAAANAPGAPRWRCGACGAEHNGWKAECGGCGTVGRIAWTTGA